jgi:hypothetical protein
MRNSGPSIFSFLLLLAAAIMLACGSGTAHIPQSVTVSPATAVASNGQAQFTATAYFNVMPSPVTPAAATWSACNFANGDNSEVTVSTTGLAQCSAGPSRTYMIFAFVPDPTFKGVCNTESLPCGGSCGGVVGVATLTCQ